MPSYQYRKSHCWDKTILRPSYLHNGISYTGEMASLYWIISVLSPQWDFLCFPNSGPVYIRRDRHLKGHLSLSDLSRNGSKSPIQDFVDDTRSSTWSAAWLANSFTASGIDAKLWRHLPCASGNVHTVTGHWAWCITYVLTSPRIFRCNAPWPLEPRTISRGFILLASATIHSPALLSTALWNSPWTWKIYAWSREMP